MSDPQKDIAQTLKKLEDIAMQAMEQMKTTTGDERQRLLVTASNAIFRRTRLLSEMGYLPKKLKE